MKVAFVSFNSYPILCKTSFPFAGGAEVQEVMLAKKLKMQGIDVAFVTMKPEDEPLEQVQGIEIITTFRQNQGIRGFRFFYPRLTSVWNALKRAKADIYYQRTASILTGICARYVKMYGGYSVFAVSHDREVGKNLNWFMNLRDRRIYKYGLLNCTLILTQTQNQKRMLRQNYNRDSIVVRNGIDVPGLLDEKESLNKVPYVLWASTFRAWKRPRLFLDLAEAMPDVKFIMCGGQDTKNPEIFNECRSRAMTLANLEFLGFITFERIGRIFDRASIFVNTSTQEGYPNTFLQAWVRKMPVVSLEVDPDGVIKAHDLGRVSGNMANLEADIKQLIENRGLRETLGSNGLYYVKTYHDSKETHRACIKVLESLFERRRQNVRECV